MQALIDQCRQQQQCTPLCIEAVQRHDGITLLEYEIQTCELLLVGDQPDEVIMVKAPPSCGGGRRLEGLHMPSPIAANVVGHWFATQAQLEAAAVLAFVELEAELAALGAPASLRRAARRAVVEEIGHARMCVRLDAAADLARALAGEPPAELVSIAGLPAGPAARALVARAREALWS